VSIKKFVDSVKKSLGLEEFKKKGKKKSVKALLKKLCERKKKITKAAAKKISKKEKHELDEELEIITLQIAKGEKILKKLK